MNAEAVENWLKERGKNKEWLAGELDISLQTIVRLLKSKTPPKERLFAISHLTGIPFEELEAPKRKRA